MYYINTCNGSKYLYVEQQARISSLESNSLQMEVPLTKHNQSVTSRVSYRLLLIDACRASVCSRPYAAAGVSAAAGAGSRASLERASVASRNYLMAGVAPRPPHYHPSYFAHNQQYHLWQLFITIHWRSAQCHLHFMTEDQRVDTRKQHYHYIFWSIITSE